MFAPQTIKNVSIEARWESPEVEPSGATTISAFYASSHFMTPRSLMDSQSSSFKLMWSALLPESLARGLH
jgi:hypothetical protein